MRGFSDWPALVLLQKIKVRVKVLHPSKPKIQQELKLKSLLLPLACSVALM